LGCVAVFIRRFILAPEISQAVERCCRIRGAQALLTGRLFDEQGRRMTSTHTNKKGVRYSYYVSQPMLHNHSSGPIGRVPAPELEAVVTDAIRRHLQASRTDTIPETDREPGDGYTHTNQTPLPAAVALLP